MVRTRMPGGVGGKAREGFPIPIHIPQSEDQNLAENAIFELQEILTAT